METEMDTDLAAETIAATEEIATPVDKKTEVLTRIRDAQWGADREDGLTALIREFQALAAEALA
ncbi:hypothetical protein [Azospirillum sp. TSO5]|uniref:hypothetical protein n=1 Tax=Azospirillum sp. TSO5 TaxID=716760 RepID=UPI000D61FE98|nr:hypothetical protein [Azospirillum sp. TSO5]PWC95459.1 hypothetical protein TSO5_10575 [Azospirillum sp. TSO5]